jgi:hypothetical protein
MPKHQPATPLPKLAFSVTAAEIVSADWRGQPPSEKLTRDEQREVIRRANAYPKLVERLRAAADHIARITNPTANYGEFQEMRDARALLGDLGETS